MEWKYHTAAIGTQIRSDKDVNRKGAKEFTKVGNELFNLFEDPLVGLNVYEKAVIMALVGQIFRYHRWSIFARRTDIARSAGISTRKVPDVLDNLEERGIIECGPLG